MSSRQSALLATQQLLGSVGPALLVHDSCLGRGMQACTCVAFTKASIASTIRVDLYAAVKGSEAAPYLGH